MSNIYQVLSDNNFKFHKHPSYFGTFIIKDLEIVNYEPLIECITVHSIRYCIYIDFKDIIPEESNFGLSFDVCGYENISPGYLRKRFYSENDFIEELHRLNSIRLNIKG